jgi:hypothetical protein
MMELGGNQRWIDFLAEHGIPEDLPIREKYSTRAAAWYRARLRAEAEGLEPPEPLPPGTGHLPMQDVPNRTVAVLDKVYSSTQCETALKRDHIMAAIALHARAEALQRKKQPTANSVPEWVCQQLQLLIDELLQLSDGDKAALKLKGMSTGKMEGFSAEKCSLLALKNDAKPPGLGDRFQIETLEGHLKTLEAS